MKFILRHCTDCSLAQRPGYGGMRTFTRTHLALLQHYQTETGNALWNPESRKQEGRVDRYSASGTPYVPKLGAALVTLEGEDSPRCTVSYSNSWSHICTLYCIQSGKLQTDSSLPHWRQIAARSCESKQFEICEKHSQVTDRTTNLQVTS